MSRHAAVHDKGFQNRPALSCYSEIGQGFPSHSTFAASATASISAEPNALNRFLIAPCRARWSGPRWRVMGIGFSAVWRSGFREMIRSPKRFRQLIRASSQIRAWSPAPFVQSARPKCRAARRISVRGEAWSVIVARAMPSAAGQSSFHARPLRRTVWPIGAPPDDSRVATARVRGAIRGDGGDLFALGNMRRQLRQQRAYVSLGARGEVDGPDVPGLPGHGDRGLAPLPPAGGIMFAGLRFAIATDAHPRVVEQQVQGRPRALRRDLHCDPRLTSARRRIVRPSPDRSSPCGHFQQACDQTSRLA